MSRIQHRSLVIVLVLIGLAACGREEAKQKAAVLASIVGDWRMPQETDVLSIQPDGAYSWGKIEGSFAGLDAQRVAMGMRKNGKYAGGMPLKVTLSNDTLRLKGPDGSIMLFVRVRP